MQRCVEGRPQFQRAPDPVCKVPQSLEIRRKIVRILLARLADHQPVLNLENAQALRSLRLGGVHDFRRGFEPERTFLAKKPSLGKNKPSRHEESGRRICPCPSRKAPPSCPWFTKPK